MVTSFVDPTTPPASALEDPEVPVLPDFPSRVCVFTIDDGYYAVDLRHIREVLPIESITPIPGMPPVVIGMTNVRGSVVPIVDLRLLLGLRPRQLPPFAVVLRHEGYELAVLVDRSPEIMTVTPDQFELSMQSSSEDSEAGRHIVNGRLKINDAVTRILDVAQLVVFLDSKETMNRV
jgi:purine-binding chemotaxis protein CheW